MEKLEEQMAHMQKTIDEMSDVIARQDKDIERLSRKVEALVLREAEREAEATGGIVIGDERPPHY